jgi:hypothetical protein
MRVFFFDRVARFAEEGPHLALSREGGRGLEDRKLAHPVRAELVEALSFL